MKNPAVPITAVSPGGLVISSITFVVNLVYQRAVATLPWGYAPSLLHLQYLLTMAPLSCGADVDRHVGLQNSDFGGFYSSLKPVQSRLRRTLQIARGFLNEPSRGRCRKYDCRAAGGSSCFVRSLLTPRGTHHSKIWWVYLEASLHVATRMTCDHPRVGQVLEGSFLERQDGSAFTDGVTNTYGSVSSSGRLGTPETRRMPDSSPVRPSVTDSGRAS